MNKITVTSFEPKQALNIAHRKEKLFHEQYSAIDTSGREIVTLRIYRSNTGGYYACVWVNNDKLYANGSGRCITGGGYNKRAAAVALAFMSAGAGYSFNLECTTHYEDVIQALAERVLQGSKASFLTVIHAAG